MYTPMSERRLCVMTAADSEQIPSLDVIMNLPVVQMSLSETYCSSERNRQNATEALRQSAVAKPRIARDFERDCPAIVVGDNQNWQLWRVDFYLARLKLYYVRQGIKKDPHYYVTGGSDIESVGHFRNCGYAYIVSPSALGLNFVIPELEWEVSYEMSSSGPEGSHSIRFVEKFKGETVSDFSGNMPSIPPFTPVASYRA